MRETTRARIERAGNRSKNFWSDWVLRFWTFFGNFPHNIEDFLCQAWLLRIFVFSFINNLKTMGKLQAGNYVLEPSNIGKLHGETE
jgi:hypothetical protein